MSDIKCVRILLIWKLGDIYYKYEIIFYGGVPSINFSCVYIDLVSPKMLIVFKSI